MSYYDLKHKIQPSGQAIAPLHTHDFFELEFLVAGERLYFTKSQMYKLQAPSLLVLSPFSTHKFESNGCEVYTLQVSPESLSDDQLNFLSFLSKKGIIHFSSQKLSPLLSILENMHKIYNSFPFNNYKKMTFNIHLGRLLHMIYSYANIQNEETHYSLIADVPMSTAPIILKVLDYLHNHYKEDFSLSDLCERFHVSKSYLSSTFAHATNTTIFQYKLSLQLEEAKRLCRETRYSYDKIAEMTGFSSGNYFRLIFKKHEGNTPNQYRYNSLKKRN
jgi:YesN/AraC family two-component response regulator